MHFRLQSAPQLAILCTTVATVVATLAAADFPLTLSQLVTGPSSHVRLTNAAAQPVTAWSLATTTSSGDGRTRREVETVDGYLSEVTEGMPGSSARLDRLLPGQSREIALAPLPADAKVELIAVVLDDGTALGDEETLRGIFERRTAERDSLSAVVAVFSEVLGSTRGAAAVDALRTRLQPIAQRDPSVPVRSAVQAVEAYQSQSSARSAEALDEALQNYARIVSRQYELAKKHAERRTK
jgi:hypothetical protein